MGFSQNIYYKNGLHGVYLSDSITFKTELENNEYDIHGFSCGDWQSDIMYLIKKIKYNEQLKNLEEKVRHWKVIIQKKNRMISLFKTY